MSRTVYFIRNDDTVQTFVGTVMPQSGSEYARPLDRAWNAFNHGSGSEKIFEGRSAMNGDYFVVQSGYDTTDGFQTALEVYRIDSVGFTREFTKHFDTKLKRVCEWQL